jgi:hypothetical protein
MKSPQLARPAAVAIQDCPFQERAPSAALPRHVNCGTGLETASNHTERGWGSSCGEDCLWARSKLLLSRLAGNPGLFGVRTRRSPGCFPIAFGSILENWSGSRRLVRQSASRPSFLKHRGVKTSRTGNIIFWITTGYLISTHVTRASYGSNRVDPRGNTNSLLHLSGGHGGKASQGKGYAQL